MSWRWLGRGSVRADEEFTLPPTAPSRLTAAEAKKEEARPLSGEDLATLLPGIRVTTYPELASVRRLTDLLANPQKAAAILFVTDELPGGVKQGHWVGLFQRSDGSVLYFDPYGKLPDAQRQWLTPGKAEALGEDRSLLAPLIADFGAGGGRVVASDESVQKLGASTATCGRHLVVRARNREVDDAAHIAEITRGRLTPDAYVTLLTEGWLRSLTGSPSK